MLEVQHPENQGSQGNCQKWTKSNDRFNHIYYVHY